MTASMIEHAAGSRWSMLVLGALAGFGGLAGCLAGCLAAEDDDSKATRVAAEASVERLSGEPLQVAEHNLTDPVGVRSGLTRLSSAGVAHSTPEPGSSARVPEPITSKHLEAELNRLEAELNRLE
jgi:hypothetical protein